MKNFVFSLERMRSYKEQVLDKEKNQLAKLRQDRDKLEQRLLEIKVYRKLKCAELQRNQLDSGGLVSYGFMMENTRHQMEDLAQELIRAEVEIEKQLRVVINASREVKGLDKLEGKQLEEYRVDEAREFNNQVEEHIVGEMLRKQRE